MKALSLFSGCGGSDLGLKRAGYSIVLANDVLPYAKAVYEANHDDTEYLLQDVSSITSFPQADLVVGCYPCQGFSQGGVREPSRKINRLYLEFARALKAVKPKAFIVENVSGMSRANFQHLLTDQISTFRSLGYTVSTSVLNAADFGVAQDRRRIFIVGIRSCIDLPFTFPKPVLAPKVTIAECLNGMPEWPAGEFYSRSFHWYYMSRDRRRDWNQQSRTIVANARHMPLHPVSPRMVKREHNVWEFESDAPARRFSFREASRIQGFPSEMVFPDVDVANQLDMKYTVVGNAVPPPLFEAVVRAMPNIWD